MKDFSAVRAHRDLQVMVHVQAVGEEVYAVTPILAILEYSATIRQKDSDAVHVPGVLRVMA